MELAKAFKTTKDLYTTEICDLLAIDKQYFKNLKKFGIKQSSVDFSYFDKYESELDEHKLANKEYKEMFKSMIKQ
jgi:hypothetical protein